MKLDFVELQYEQDYVSNYCMTGCSLIDLKHCQVPFWAAQC